MNLIQGVKIGFVELESNKLRSFLTMLGVIFGVAAVVASVAIGEGAREQALRQVALMGTNNIRLKSTELNGQTLAISKQKNPRGLSLMDCEAIRANCPDLKNLSPSIFLKEKAWLNGQSIKGDITATSPEYTAVTNFHPASGRFFNQEDIDLAARVCVIGAEIKDDYFGGGNPLDQILILSNNAFTIIGVMEDKRLPEAGTGIVSTRNMNRDIYIPYTSALKRLSPPDENNELSEISIQISSQDKVMVSSVLIRSIITRMHNEVDNFELIVPLELLKQSQATQRRFNLVLAAIAGISLLVGGIGIMNIMLASVTQRIQEVGIRRALGATRRDILNQFLIESTVLSLVGGMIGIVSGMILGHVISLYAKWATVYSLKAIVLSFVVAGSVGIIFGIYPARKAANLNPIEALRYE